MTDVDVVVVGAGPSGLTVAGDLALGGCSVLVLERRAGINPHGRAIGIHPRTLELLDSRGVTPFLLEDGLPMLQLRFAQASPQKSRVPTIADEIDTPFPFTLALAQPNTDYHLLNYAKKQGAIVEFNAKVIGLEGAGEKQIITVETPEGVQNITARFLVAADGAHSTVRSLLGLPFPGKTVFASAGLAELVFESDINAHVTGPYRDGKTFIFLLPITKNREYRLMLWERGVVKPDSEPMTDAEIVYALNRYSPHITTPYTVINRSRFHSDERIINNYRHRNIFFVGDSAHCHSPVGGQGMNTGIGDAINLAWKLARAVHAYRDPRVSAHTRQQCDTILLTYNSERRPIGKQAIRRSGILLRINATSRLAHPLSRFIFGLTNRIRPLRRANLAGLTGMSVRYSAKNLSGNKNKIIGTRAGFMVKTQEARNLLGQGKFILAYNPNEGVNHHSEKMNYYQRDDHGPTVLVRPDGYIAWVKTRQNQSWEQEWHSWEPTERYLT